MPANNLQVIDGLTSLAAPETTILQPRNAPPIRLFRYDGEIVSLSEVGGSIQIELTTPCPAAATAVAFFANGAWQRGAIVSGAGTTSILANVAMPVEGILTYTAQSVVFDVPYSLRAYIYIATQGSFPRRVALRYSRDEFGHINLPLWNAFDFADNPPPIVGALDANATNVITEVLITEFTPVAPLDGVSLADLASVPFPAFVHKEKLTNAIRGAWADEADGYFLGKRVANMNGAATRNRTLTHPDQPIWCGYPSPMSLVVAQYDAGASISSNFLLRNGAGAPVALNTCSWGVFPPTMFCEFTPCGTAWDAGVNTGGEVLYAATPMMDFEQPQRFELRPSRYNTHPEQEVFLVARSPIGGWVWWLFESAKPMVAVTNTTTFANSYFPPMPDATGGYLQPNVGSNYAVGRVPAPRKSVESTFQVFATQIADVHAPIFAMLAASEEVYWARVRNPQGKYYGEDFAPNPNNADLPIELVRVDIQPANTQIANESLAAMGITFNVTVSNE